MCVCVCVCVCVAMRDVPTQVTASAKVNEECVGGSVKVMDN